LGPFSISGAPALVSLVAGVPGREVEINVIIQQAHRDLGKFLDVLELLDFFH
jgi:hypothetical protein